MKNGWSNVVYDFNVNITTKDYDISNIINIGLPHGIDNYITDKLNKITAKIKENKTKFKKYIFKKCYLSLIKQKNFLTYYLKAQENNIKNIYYNEDMFITDKDLNSKYILKRLIESYPKILENKISEFINKEYPSNNDIII